jgi:rod shape-determining protein MreC
MGGFLPPAERRSGALLALYAALSLLMLLTGERIPTAALRGVGAALFSPFDRLVLGADRMAAAWRENQRLHQRVAELLIENERLRIGGIENQRLREQLGLPAARGYRVKPVEILALAGEGIPTAATVSAGRRQGIAEGDAVVTGDGLLGRIGEVHGGLSRVVMLTDPNSAVACEVESTGVLGVLRFTLTPHPRLVLTNVPLADTVRTGQRILTSGLSQRYPRGLPVGQVVGVRPDASGLMLDVEVQPAARLSRLRHAFVLPRGGAEGAK